MECPRRGHLPQRFDQPPLSLFEVELEEVVVPVLEFIDTSEDEHGGPDAGGCMSVASSGLDSLLDLLLVPVVGYERVGVQLVKGVAAIPAAEDVHLVPVDLHGVSEARAGKVSVALDLGDFRVLDVVLVQVIELVLPVRAAVDVDVLLVQGHYVVHSRRDYARLEQHRPLVLRAVELVEVVEVLALPVGVATKVVDLVSEDDAFGAGARVWGVDLALVVDVVPGFGGDVEGVHVVEDVLVVGAAEEVEFVVEDGDGVAGPGGEERALAVLLDPLVVLVELDEGVVVEVLGEGGLGLVEEVLDEVFLERDAGLAAGGEGVVGLDEGVLLQVDLLRDLLKWSGFIRDTFI